MRIIDKNTDFYDYLQGIYRDDSITFDRTDSFMLTKNIMCEYLNRWSDARRKNRPWGFVLLQICNSFWLFVIKITKQTDSPYYYPENYTVDLISKWDNYKKPRHLMRLDLIDFGINIYQKGWYKWFEIDELKLKDHADDLMHAIDQNNYRLDVAINKYTYYGGDGTKKEKHIPLLKASGLATWIDPLDAYLAFERYFLLEKSSLERTESVGLTDKEKIGNHGFDVKTSFRGK